MKPKSRPDLLEEEADTTTVGLVYQSSWIPGLNLSVDYWSIEIEQAISAVTGDDIVQGCYIGHLTHEGGLEGLLVET